MKFDAETLYNLLPAVYRIRDAEQGEPLRALLEVLAGQGIVLEEDLERLYDDLFVETAAPWAIPYIGDLIGLHGVQGSSRGRLTPRAEVANTIGYRRRKGTAAMLEQLARDVTGWPARAVEFFQILCTTQYMNHLRQENQALLGVHDAGRLECLGGAFEHLPPAADLPHTAEVRRIANGRGRYNIGNVGIFLWRLKTYSLTRSPAVSVSAASPHHQSFSPLGQDTPLFTLPITEDEVASLASPLNVSAPITRRALYQSAQASERLADYYGRAASFVIETRGASRTVEPEVVPAADIIVADLSDWGYTVPDGKVAVDPALGRISLPDGDQRSLLVSFHYGFSANIGGGEYDRVKSFTSLGNLRIVASVYVDANNLTQTYGTVQEAIADLPPDGGVIEIADSGRYDVSGLSLDAAGKRIELRAADKCRPTLVHTSDLSVTGGAADEVSLNGLLIAGGTVRVTGNLGLFRLRHCTIVPGATPALIAESRQTRVEMERCVVAPVYAHREAQVRVSDSIIDATADTSTAYAGTDGANANADPAERGAPLTIENSTVIGLVNSAAITLASNDIFLSPVSVERHQEGCIRFSYVAPESRTPRRYRCLPDSDVDAARLRPVFTSTHYGDPAYLQLDQRCAEEVRTGAEDESEMGAFRHLFQSHREAYLRSRLDEYLRFGLEAGLIFAS